MFFPFCSFSSSPDLCLFVSYQGHVLTRTKNGLCSISFPSQSSQIQNQHSSVLKRVYPAHHHTTQPAPILRQKRKLSATDLEIPDSDAEDDEDYGWADEDEEDLPPAPPQWQGTEDELAPSVDVDEEEGDEELLELGMGGDAEDSEGSSSEGAFGDGGEVGGKQVGGVVIDDSEDELAL